MFRKSGQIAILAGATAGLLIAVATDADARQWRARKAPHGVMPIAADEWQATDHCAAYGPDFTSVAGSDACVRIGGRVRVQFSFHRSQPDPNGGWTTTTQSVTIHSDGTPQSVTIHTEKTPRTGEGEDVYDGLEQGHLHVHSVGAVESPDPLR